MCKERGRSAAYLPLGSWSTLLPPVYKQPLLPPILLRPLLPGAHTLYGCTACHQRQTHLVCDGGVVIAENNVVGLPVLP